MSLQTSQLLAVNHADEAAVRKGPDTENTTPTQFEDFAGEMVRACKVA